MLPDKRARNVYNDIIYCEAPPPNLNSANIIYAWFGAKLPNLKDCQHFWLHSTTLVTLRWCLLTYLQP